MNVTDLGKKIVLQRCLIQAFPAKFIKEEIIRPLSSFMPQEDHPPRVVGRGRVTSSGPWLWVEETCATYSSGEEYECSIFSLPSHGKLRSHLLPW